MGYVLDGLKFDVVMEMKDVFGFIIGISWVDLDVLDVEIKVSMVVYDVGLLIG